MLHDTPSGRRIFVVIMYYRNGTRRHTPGEVRKPKSKINPALYRIVSCSSPPRHHPLQHFSSLEFNRNAKREVVSMKPTISPTVAGLKSWTFRKNKKK